MYFNDAETCKNLYIYKMIYIVPDFKNGIVRCFHLEFIRVEIAIRLIL